MAAYSRLVIVATTPAGKTPASTAREAHTPRTCYSRGIMLTLPVAMAQAVAEMAVWVFEEALALVSSFVTALMMTRAPCRSVMRANGQRVTAAQ